MNRKSLLPFLHVLFAICFLLPEATMAQQRIMVSLATIDGVEITPENIFNIRIQSLGSKTSSVLVKGSIRYRNSPLSASYSFTYAVGQGTTMISSAMVHPQWQFSSAALQELFFNHHVLPAGTFEYCVTVDPVNGANEVLPGGGEECLYHQSEETFLINLISPENKAKLYEYYPMLNWVANYSFSNELTYRLRVAEMKGAQNPTNAILRNQPVYDEKNIFQNSKVYPTYAKPLAHDQPYAWTVDAYYKGILLGSAEAWQFIIKDDTVFNGPPGDRSYIDVKKESGFTRHYAEGLIKLKYFLDRSKKESLKLSLVNSSGEQVNLKTKVLGAVYGDNRYIIDFRETASLKHQEEYTLLFEDSKGNIYKIPFTYMNPDLAK